MKGVELRLISELMKNARRSDRELAKAVGISQPTLSRMINRLEKEGVIREYTMIPDFLKLGYELMVVSFVKTRKDLSGEKLEEARRMTREKLEKEIQEIMMLEKGVGLGYNGVIISLHKDYSSFQDFTNWMAQFESLLSFETDSFIISLADKIRYRSLTLSTLANHIIKLETTAIKTV